jgi:hypothetical protein
MPTTADPAAENDAIVVGAGIVGVSTRERDAPIRWAPGKPGSRERENANP